MNAPGLLSPDLAIPAEFQARFDAQREVFLKAPEASHVERLADLRAPTRLPTENQTAIPGARNRLIPQALGVVGVIVPWNYPIFLSFGPLTGALAAGNRTMVKMSENSRALVELLAGISPKYLPEDKLAFFADGGGRGPAFSSLPVAYLFFTRHGTTRRAVLAKAARKIG